MIYRVQPKNNFTCIENQLLTIQLKPSAKLVLIDLLSKHPDFKITISAVCNDLGVGRDYVRSAFDALQRAGYLQCHKCRRANGTYDTVYDVFSHPDLAKQNLPVMPLSKESDRHKPLKQHPCRSTRVGLSDTVNPTPNNTTKKQKLSSHYLSQYPKDKKEQTDRMEFNVHTPDIDSEGLLSPTHLQDKNDLEYWKSYIAQSTVSLPVKQAVSTLQESDLADIQVMMQQWESNTPDAMLRILVEVAAAHHPEAMSDNLADSVSWDTLEFQYQVRYRIACKKEQKNIWDAVLTVIRTATGSQSPAYRLSGQLVTKKQLADKLRTLTADEIYTIVSTCSEHGQAVRNWSGYILAALYNGIQQDAITKQNIASQELGRRVAGEIGSNRSASGQRRNRFHNFDQRDYDYDAWKQELLAPYRQAEPAEVPDFSDMLSKYRAVAGD